MIDDKPIYFDALKADWRSGMLSVRLLRIKYGLKTDEDVNQMALKAGWGPRGKATRDKIEDVATRTLIDQTVAAVDSAIQARDGRQTLPQSGGVLVDDGANIDRYGQILATVVTGQRRTAWKGRRITDHLLDELESITPPQIDEEAIESMAAAVEGTHPELAAALRKNPDMANHDAQMKFLSRRIGQMRDLSDSVERFVDLERRVWNLDKSLVPGDGDSMDDMMAWADKQRESAVG